MPKPTTARPPRRSGAFAPAAPLPEQLLRAADAALEGGWLVLAALAPLALDTLHAQPALPKGQLLQLVVLLMALVWLGRWLLARRLGAPPFPAAPPTPSPMSGLAPSPGPSPTSGERGTGGGRLLVVLAAAHAAAVLLATALSPVPGVAFWGTYVRGEGAVATLAYLLLFLIVADRLRTRAQWDRLVTVLLAASVPVCLYGLAQAFGRDPLTWDQLGPGGRVASTAGNPIFLAGYLILLLPLTAWRLAETCALARTRAEASTPQSGWLAPAALAAGAVALAAVLVGGAQRADVWWALPPLSGAFALAVAAAPPLPAGAVRPRRLAYGALLGLQGWTLVLTASIGPVLGLLGAVGAAAALYAARRRRWGLLGALAGVGLLAAAFVVVLNLPNTPLAPLQERVLLLRRLGNLEQTGAGLRLIIWRASVDLVLHPRPLGEGPDPLSALRPLVGYGPDTIGYQVNRVLPPPAALEFVLGGFWDRTHNAVLDQLLTTGILGLATYLLLVGVVVGRAARGAWAEFGQGRYGAAAALLVALVGHGLETQTSMLVLPGVAVFWLLAGAAVHEPWRQPAPEAASAPQWPPVAVYSALAVGLLAALPALPGPLPALPAAAVTAALLLAALGAWALARGPLGRRARAAVLGGGLVAIAVALLLGAHQVRLLAADAVFRRSEEAQARRDFPRAILAGQEAVRLAPDQAEYWSVLGQYYAAFGGGSRAAPRPGFVPSLQEARETRQPTLLARDQLFELGRLCVEEALRLDPLEFRYWWTLGELYRYWGELSEDAARLHQARELFERAAALKPNDVEAEAGLADTLLLLGDPATAIVRAERARALLPRYWYPYAILARAYERQGELARAREAAEQALATAPITRGVKGLSAFERTRLEGIIQRAAPAADG
jgi:tetratricopeptide (TPR) repeat protein/O-antigen ligase